MEPEPPGNLTLRFIHDLKSQLENEETENPQLRENYETQLAIILSETSFTLYNDEDVKVISFLKELHGWRHGSVRLEHGIPRGLRRYMKKSLKKLKVRIRA